MGTVRHQLVAAPRGFHLATFALAAFSVAVFIITLLEPFSAKFVLTFEDVATASAASVATLGMLVTCLKNRGAARLALALITSGLGCWSVGDWGWMSYNFKLGEVPFPSWLDMFYLAGYPLITVGAVLLASPRRLLAQMRTMLDAIALIAALTAVVWHLVLIPTYSASDTSVSEKVIAGFYPIGDLVVFFAAALAVVGRTQAGISRVTLTLFTVGIGLIVVADLGFASFALNDITSGVNWLSALWTYGYVLIALFTAMAICWPIAVGKQGALKTSGTSGQATPLILLAALLGYSASHAEDLAGDPVYMVLVGVAVSAILARQLVVLNDNTSLNNRLAKTGEELERLVQGRTAELSRLVSVIEASTDFVATADIQGNVLYVNRAGRRMVGIGDDEDVTAMKVEDFHPAWAAEVITERGLTAALKDGSWSGDMAVVARDGSQTPVSQLIIAHRAIDGAPAYFSTVARDLTDRKDFESRLTQLANHDSLTDLFNRRRFEEEVDQELAKIRRFGGSAGLLFLDLDGFKYVNDDLGHRAGDELLISLARVLHGALRETDVLARLGGDEFAMLLPRTDQAEAEAMAAGLLEEVRGHRMVLQNQPIRITASLGIAMAPSHATSTGELLACADMAMYLAKEHRDSSQMFSAAAAADANFTTQRVWEQRIRTALDEDLFVLYAQPIVDLHEGSTQYELLIRMHGEDGELIQPASFLPVAERSGLIHDIDRWVVCKAIDILADYEARGQDLSLEVNLSGKAFADQGLLSLLEERLRATGVTASRLILEITETAAISNINQASHFIESLKSLGCKFAIDDFGVGFSSFYYLKRLPVDYLKIDGSFIRDLPRDAADQHLVRSMVALAHGLGKRTIAEFVGDQATVNLLRLYGVDAGQGYFLGKPQLLEEYEPERETAAA